MLCLQVDLFTLTILEVLLILPLNTLDFILFDLDLLQKLTSLF